LEEQAFLSLDVQVMLQQMTKHVTHHEHMLGAYIRMSSIYTTTPCPCRSLTVSSTKAWKNDGAFNNP
jgi:hypothetical protein